MDGIYCSTTAVPGNGGLATLDALPRSSGPLAVCPCYSTRDTQRCRHRQALASVPPAVGIGRPYAYGLALGESEA